MILNLFYKILLSFIFITISFQANTNEDINEKVKRLTLELRCMTCQNQSVYDSEAEFSNDIKNIVQTKFEEGKTEKEIKIFLVERYGEYILFRPMVDYKNLFLWAFPFVLLAISLFFIVFRVKKNKV
ncbi:MAG: cytochrome c-type biogenesis protein CcmH [Alphaproteobacteria bacterium]